MWHNFINCLSASICPSSLSLPATHNQAITDFIYTAHCHPPKPSFATMPDSFFQRLLAHHPVLLPTVLWTVLLTLTVSVASLASATAFMAAVSPSSSSFSSNPHEGCQEGSDDVDGPIPCLVGIPLGIQGEILRVPKSMVGMSEFDFLLPTVFAAVAVFSSACLLRSLGLWEVITAAEGS
ncbi:hypothetical protein SAY87_032373 [Trapa incisa]|uniref:Uncharacterized protein n=1 Tax=Trapa incisa TaxID=236973 RepID=A0AAN7J8G0_9MYRT|nr:hypothetical protein SAY87_032373 [Trapa incisa]